MGAAKLSDYRRKRDFQKTAEPKGQAAKSKTGRLFVVQKHDASRLHYDLRLELDGVLKSWAVPKGPSLDPQEKVLAVEVEDHPVEYGSFEGVIPKGEYGGGTVMLWDRGVWHPKSDNPAHDYHTGKFKFTLEGEKLRGGWMLVRMHGREGDDSKKNWLLFKEKDGEARPSATVDVRKSNPLSVATGRSLDQIAHDQDRVWNSNRPSSNGRASKQRRPTTHATAGVKARDAAARVPARGLRRAEVDPSSLTSARKAALPSSPQPQLATLVQSVPEGDDWVHEVKFDGYRILAVIHGKGKEPVSLLTRRGNNWTDKFMTIAKALEELALPPSVLDGELVVVDEKGASQFQALQNLALGRGQAMVYFAFDLLHYGGFDLTHTPLVERKQLLAKVLTASSVVQYSDHVQGHGQEVERRSRELRIEGVVSKRAMSTYITRRTRDWLKVKFANRQEFVIGGYTDPSGSRTGFGALLLGYYDDAGELVYCGRVGTGFNEKLLAGLLAKLKKAGIDTTPFRNPPPKRGVHWVRPQLVCEVQFMEWTGDGILRHPSFLGLREDKLPREVKREVVRDAEDRSMRASKSDVPRPPVPKRKEPGKPVSGNGQVKIVLPPKDVRLTISGVSLSNPGRVLYPEIGVTKIELAEFYINIAKWVVPHVTNRPLSIVRCPQGRGHPCFYQKHLKEALPPAIRGIPVAERTAEEDYLVIDDLKGLVSFVQLGALEIHPWGCREDKVEVPDRVIFDLDPGPGVEWEGVNEGAIFVRDRLADLGLTSFVKTSGGKGLHVVVPLVRRAGWDDAKEFARAVAESIVRAQPGKYIATMTKAKRPGKIFLDFFRNGRGATSVAAYSTRAREGAPVSTPVAWNELSARLTSTAFNVRNLPSRLASLKQDPWKGFLTTRQSLTAKVLKQARVQ